MATTRARPRTPRRASSLSAWWALALLGLLVAATSVYVAYYGVRDHGFQPDGWEAVLGGRLFQRDFFGALRDHSLFDRGPERLTSMVMWIPNSIFATTPDQMRAAHVLLGTVFCAAAIPAYALARGLRLATWQALAVAAMTVIGPWLVLGTTFLNVTLALPLTAAFAWACWHTAVRPSPGADALVLLFAGLNLVARAGHGPFAVVALIAVLYAAWKRRPDGERRHLSLLRLPVRVGRTHPLLVGVSVAALLALLVIGPAALFGGSPYAGLIKLQLNLKGIWRQTGVAFTQLTMGTGYLPVIVGGPWLLMQLIRPRSLEAGVFAVTGLALFAVFVYVTGSAGAPAEERYVAVLGFVPVVAFGAAVFRREVSLLGSAVFAVLAVRAVVTRGIYPDDGPDSYTIGPARQFFSNVIVGRLSITLPFGGGHVATIAMVLVGLAALALVLVLRARTRPQLTRIAVIAGVAAVLVTGVTAGAYAMRKYEPGRQPWLTWQHASWIDRATAGQPAFIWTYDPRGTGGPFYTSLLATYFNRSLCCYIVYDLGPGVDADHGGKLRLFKFTPRYVAHFTGYARYGLDARRVKVSTELGPEPVVLERFNGAPNLSFSIAGANSIGEVPVGGRAVIHVFPPARRRGACLIVPVAAPAEVRRAGRVLTSPADTSGRGGLRLDRLRMLRLPVARRSNVTIRSTVVGRSAGGPSVSQVLGEVRVLPCTG